MGYCRSTERNGLQCIWSADGVQGRVLSEQDECCFLRKCEVEESKQLVSSAARSLPDAPPLHTKCDVFEPSSAFLNDLKRKRDNENGCRSGELSQHYSREEAYWRGMYTPIDRRIAQTPHDVVETRQQSVSQEQWFLFDQELDAHVERETDEQLRTRAGLCREFVRYALKWLSPLGFMHDRHKSPRNCPTLTKPLTEAWDLRFTPRWTKGWRIGLFSDCSTRPGELDMDPQLVLCRSNVTEQVGDHPFPGLADKMLEVRYYDVVPGFGSAYRFFSSTNDMELILLAHAKLLEMTVLDFEQAVVPKLSKHPAASAIE